ncbi:MAG: IS4 family transposase [Bacteroidales bacterium]|jgi:hypothetical protein|nr:IS4 family transposase [Bacteroidales bacterium]
MGKSTNFSGQPIFTQLLNFLDKSKISKSSKALGADKYVKRFTSYKHVVVMLFAAFEGYNSIRETVLGLLSNAHRLQHLGLDYLVRRSTLSEANARRTPEVFADAYYDTYKRFSGSLTDSCLSKTDMKRLYIMDSTTITLFKDILRGVGRNPANGKRKGGIKAHTIIRSEDNQPCFIRYTEAAKHDHLLLKDVELPQDSILCFDKGYVDYAQYEVFTQKSIWYVTRLKDNALYEARKEFDIPDDADSGILKDELIELSYGKSKAEKHVSRRIAYWDSTNGRLFEFITNNMDLAAEDIARIYKKRWQIELLFKQLKQNFPLKYFLGDNENAIIIQIWSVMLANLLLMILKSQIHRKWAFSNMVSIVRQHLMSYINAKSFFENPEKAWQELIEEQKARIKEKELNNQNLLFPNWEGAYF